MKVRHVMRTAIRCIAPTATAAQAAAAMADSDIGALVVVADHRIVGIVTDRDLALRCLAAGLPGDTPVSQVMSGDVTVCSPGDELADVLRVMSEQQIRRIPVCAPSGEPLGMLSLGDAAQCEEYVGEAAATLACICRPSVPDLKSA